MKDQDAEPLARELATKYRRYLSARAQVKAAVRALLAATLDLAAQVKLIRGTLRGSFARWCRIHCPAYEAREGKAVLAVAEKTGDLSRIETWQLRGLNVITAIHHAVRPMAAQRKQKSMSLVGAVGSIREKVGKLIQQGGGRLDPETQAVIDRQLSSIATLRDQVRSGRKA